MRRIRILNRIMKQTGASKLILGFLIFTVVSGFIIWIFDPTIDSFGDALWFCYAVVTTCGFGDVVVNSFVARVMSVILSVYAVLIIAIITGIVVEFYKELVTRRNEATFAAFLDKLETLPELSRDELAELSERVKKFRKSGK